MSAQSGPGPRSVLLGAPSRGHVGGRQHTATCPHGRVRSHRFCLHGASWGRSRPQMSPTLLPGPGGGHLGSSPSGRLCGVPRRSRDHLRGALTANHLIYIWVPDLSPSPGVGRSSYTRAGTPPAHAGQPVSRALGLLPPAAATKSDRTQGTWHPGTASAEAAIQSGKKNMHFLSVSDDLESGES